MSGLAFPFVFECSDRDRITTVEWADTLLTSICLVSTCLVFSVWPALGQSQMEKSLAKLDGVKVLAAAAEGVHEAGLSNETLRSITELQLRKADINVYTQEEWVDDPAGPVIFVTITASNNDGLLAYSTSAELSQTVFTTAGTQVSGTTWKATGFIGTARVDDARDPLTENVKQMVREFINDWLAAHEQ